MSTVCGTGTGNFPQPGDPSTLVALAAQSVLGGILLSWTFPSLNSHAVAHFNIYRSTEGDAATRMFLGKAQGTSYMNYIGGQEAGIVYYYWIEVVSVHGTVGELNGPASAQFVPHGDMIAGLVNGRLDEGQLTALLRERLDQIGQFQGLLADETGARNLDMTNVFNALGIVETDLEAIDTVVANETIERTTADSALVNQINLLYGRVDENQAGILEEKNIRVGETEALAENITTLFTDVEGNSSTLQTHGQSLDGISASYMVKTNVNGHVAGYGLFNEDGASQFVVAVESFAVATLQQTYFPFIIDGNQIRFNGVVSFDNVTGPKPPTDATRNVYRGAWVSDANYREGDIINDEGIGYIAAADHIASTLNKPPSSFWGLLADRGPQGVAGDPGTDGTVYYTWIRYADDAVGAGISNDPTGKEYIGFAYQKTSATESNDPLDYKWSKISGEQGVEGPKGADGEPRYTWIAYSDSSDGSNMYQTPTTTTEYIGIATNKLTATESSDPLEYIWSKFRGDVGPEGVPGPKGDDGVVYYTWIRYGDDESGAGISNSPTGKTHMGLAYNKLTATESNDPLDYIWSRFRGEDGTQGVQGPAGDDGQPRYTWIAYSDSSNGAGMYQVPTSTTEYIGIATNKLTATESTDPADYIWSKFRGDPGTDGLDGAKGDKGDRGDRGLRGYTGSDGDTGEASAKIFRRGTSVSKPSNGSTYPPTNWSLTVPPGSNPVWECTGNKSAGSTYWTWGTPLISAEYWTKPSSTLIDGNKIFTGEAYVDTLEIKGQAVTVPVGKSNTANTVLSTNDYHSVAGSDITVDLTDIGEEKGAVVVTMVCNFLSLVTGSTERDIAVSIQHGSIDHGEMVMSTFQGFSQSMANSWAFTNLNAGNHTFRIRAKCTTGSNIFKIGGWTISAMGVKR